MIPVRSSLLLLAALSRLGAAAPAASSASVSESVSETPTATDSAALAVTTVPFASTDPNEPLWDLDSPDSVPSPVRGSLGAPLLGPDNIPMDLENPDLFAPPTTDNGDTGNSKWPFALSHNRLQTGGWARQENIEVMPIATAMASVDMRLEAGAIRELHWHKTSEWAYVLKGTSQITAVDTEGRNFIANVRAGDLWFFPPGIPHSIQATGDDPEGTEFLLIFDDGAFSEDSTFLTGLHMFPPKAVISKNFQVNNSEAFAHIPDKELYIFPSTVPPDDQQAPVSPQGTIPQSYMFPLSTLNATQLSGGSVKIVDSTIFPISTTIAAAEVTVEPGAMRELHWHPTMDEWSFFIEGTGRVTVFASQSNARTFNYQPGDIGYVPAAMGHYVENTGNTTLKFLEIFNSDRFQDISLNQWLALTPPSLVKAHLNLDDATIAQLSKTKPIVIG
ncbi:oxalate decarboxylase [Lentinula raphanica]|uniref:Oxalate decarboxylase n=1 Tax=Lentinula raphanica TaxID=153919 RepID=A0AA38PBT0_9AGAR|nr:oxalate decarboxylase [Lentinula raphanica]KAJ3819259.1 oxalate decarboxylase [Lentinula raphanica]KAJ3840022.1 oxalate decarboxylase [Lentinula raphanica]